MERIIREVDLPEIEAEKIFKEILKYEHSLIKDIVNGDYKPCKGFADNEYFSLFRKEYVKLISNRARILERK